MYQKHLWLNGEVITDDKLNHIENGIVDNEPFIVTFSGTSDNGNAECDRTFEEIEEAFSHGKEINLRYFRERRYYYLLKYIALDNRGSLIDIGGAYYNVVDPNDLELGCVSIGANINSINVHARYTDI